MSDQKIIRLNDTPERFGASPDTLEPAQFASALPVQNTHVYYENEQQGLYIGVWDTTAMVEAAGPYDCDEFMWVLDGELEIKNCQTGDGEIVRAGEAFVIPRGYDCQWHQRGYLRKFFVISEGPGEALPDAPVVEGIVKINFDTPEINTTTTSASQFNGAAFDGLPVHRERVCYQNASGTFEAGTRESSAFVTEMQPYPRNEFVYVQHGSLVLTDAQGTEQIFNGGDAFFIARGTPCKWRVKHQAQCLYAVI